MKKQFLLMLSFVGLLSLNQVVQAQDSPIVTATGRAPTGYEVTFRLDAPNARSVHIKGEWYFARPSELEPFAGTPEHPIVEGGGILPKDWQPGDFPLQSPNSTGPNFPIAEMSKGEDGIWSYTTPLPSGVYTYAFIIDCDNEDLNRCPRIADPSNMPWNNQASEFANGRVSSSQVYVPSDPAFGTMDYSWQGPAQAQGSLEMVTYDSPGHLNPIDKNYLVVYLPPGYDPNRAEPYPTVWVSHGGGENEMGWSTQGVLANIMDNLIFTGQIQPMVVVMPNGTGAPESDFQKAFSLDIVNQAIPFIEQRYNVSSEPMDRAFTGLSAGGMRTNSMMINHPGVFGYYGMMSAGLPPEYVTLTEAHARALDHATVFVGSGWQDSIHAAGWRQAHYGPAREVQTLREAGIPVVTNFVNGGHSWHVWRILLRDFVTRVAFMPRV